MELKEVELIYEYLRKVEEEQTDKELLFHGTSLSSIKDIADTGTFIPQRKNGSDALANGYPEEYFKGYVFLTNCDYNAGHYCSLACSNTGDYSNGNILTILGVLLPKSVLLPDLCDAPDATNWEESLKKVKAVSVKGEYNIPKEDMFLLFTDYDSAEPLYLTTELDVPSAFNQAVSIQKERDRE